MLLLVLLRFVCQRSAHRHLPTVQVRIPSVMGTVSARLRDMAATLRGALGTLSRRNRRGMTASE